MTNAQVQARLSQIKAKNADFQEVSGGAEMAELITSALGGIADGDGWVTEIIGNPQPQPQGEKKDGGQGNPHDGEPDGQGQGKHPKIDPDGDGDEQEGEGEPNGKGGGEGEGNPTKGPCKKCAKKYEIGDRVKIRATGETKIVTGYDENGKHILG